MKNINNFLILFIFIFFVNSCSNNKLNEEENSNELSKLKNIEELETVENSIYINNNKIFDFYNRNNNFIIEENIKIKKNYQFKLKNKKIITADNPFNFIIDNNSLYYFDNNLKLVEIDLINFNIINEIQLDINTNADLIYPTTIAKTGDDFVIGLANGIIFKTKKDGNIIWERNFSDLLKTPIKIIENNIILLFNSNKIISLDLNYGKTLWEFNYAINKPSLSTGGQIIEKNNLIFFIMPNGRIGAIDNIVGEILNDSFLNEFLQKNILNFNYSAKINIYKNLFSLIENNNTIHTYDFSKNDFLIFNEKILNSKSLNFLNNSLLSLEKNNLLKSYNLKNKNIFWELNLSKFISKKDLIEFSYSYDNLIIVIFTSGKLLKINKNTGQLINKYDLNFKDINLITTTNNFIIINQINGKIVFYSK